MLLELSNRVDVNALPLKEVVDEALKTTDICRQLWIIHDLLMVGLEAKTVQQRNMVCSAGELCVKISPQARQEFMMYVLGAPVVLATLASVIFANYAFHLCLEEKKRGSSGLSTAEFAVEKQLSDSLAQFRR